MEKIKAQIRKCGKPTDFFLLASFLAILMVMVGGALSGITDRLIPFDKIFNAIAGDEAIGTFLGMYFDFYGIWILFFIVNLAFKANRPIARQLSFKGTGNGIKGLLIGCLLGFGTNGFCILMSALVGDIKLSFNGFNPLLFILFFICVTIQSGAEEIVDRAYLYQKLRRRYRHPAVAIILNALVFMALHLTNPGIGILPILQIVIVAIFFSLLVYYYDCLWAAIMMHASWNFCQSIFFGLPNSGIVSAYSVFKLEAASARNGFFYNADFGVEGSPAAVILLTILCIVIVMINRGKSEKHDLWAEMEAEAESNAAAAAE